MLLSRGDSRYAVVASLVYTPGDRRSPAMSGRKLGLALGLASITGLLAFVLLRRKVSGTGLLAQLTHTTLG